MRLALLILVAIGSLNPTQAQEPGVTIPPELIRARFTVNKGGAPLLVPVHIAGKERLFLVDTGCSCTLVDAALVPMGRAKAIVNAEAGHREVPLKQYPAPDGSVGHIPLGLDTVIGADLVWLREHFRSPIEGILGMDFLRRYVVHFDFDRGELLLLFSVPRNSGEILPILWTDSGCPQMEASISSGVKVRFEVDTGLVGFNSGIVEGNALKLSHDYRKIGSLNSTALSGGSTSPMFQGKHLTLGSFSIDGPILSESGTASSLLGISFFARFTATFDFPHQKVYLCPGAAYKREDLADLSGVRLARKNSEVVINQVDDFSPAALAGLKEGDVLLTLGSKRVEEGSAYERHKAPCTPGELPCTIRRGPQELRLTLNFPR